MMWRGFAFAGAVVGLSGVLWLEPAPAGACSPPETEYEHCRYQELIAVDGEFLSSAGEPVDLGPELIVLMEAGRVYAVVVDGVELRTTP